MYAFLRHDMRSDQSFLVVANLHRSTTFKNVHIHFSPEALDFLKFPAESNASPFTFNERLADKNNLALTVANRSELSTSGLVIPAIAPLTPLYFAIGIGDK